MPPAKKSLIDLLDSSSEKERAAALERVPHEGDLVTLAVCRRVAREDPSGAVRDLAARAMKSLANAIEDIPADVDRRLSDPDPAVRLEWVATVGLSQEATHLPRLAETVLSETDAGVRAALALAIGILGVDEHLDLIVNMLGDKESRVRLAALEALEALGHPEGMQLVVRALRDPESSVRSRAMRRLRRLGPERMFALCADMVRAREAWRRESAVQLVASSGLPEAVPVLAQALSDPVASIADQAREALEALAKSGIAEARTALESAPRRGQDVWADSVFAAIEAPTDVDRSDPIFDDDPAVRLKRIESIVKGKLLKETPRIESRVAHEEDPVVLERLLVALGQLQSRASVPLLQKGLSHSAASVRRAALEALHLINDHGSLAPALPLLADPDPVVKEWAVVTLSVLETAPYLAPLDLFLGSRLVEEALLGIDAVERIKTKKVVERLGPLLNHGTDRVRVAAREALERLAQKKNPTAIGLIKGVSALAAPAARPEGRQGPPGAVRRPRDRPSGAGAHRRRSVAGRGRGGASGARHRVLGLDGAAPGDRPAGPGGPTGRSGR
ncbi:MAG: HEAT repeat domain-containing protein [Candidatus Riflebacteria bacterium]|nr:HEAT repeat domain-containing protein [Candidatus Riflebacteria bacterium]